jgi:hypothetical protein
MIGWLCRNNNRNHSKVNNNSNVKLNIIYFILEKLPS